MSRKVNVTVTQKQTKAQRQLDAIQAQKEKMELNEMKKQKAAADNEARAVAISARNERISRGDYTWGEYNGLLLAGAIVTGFGLLMLIASGWAGLVVLIPGIVLLVLGILRRASRKKKSAQIKAEIAAKLEKEEEDAQKNCPKVLCPYCGASTPAGEKCTYCGAKLPQ